MTQSYTSTIICPVDGLAMPAVPPGMMTRCPHCQSVYYLDDRYELSLLETPTGNSPEP